MSEINITPENAVESYRTADASGKAKIRKLVQSNIMAAVGEADLATAQAWVAVQSALVATPSARTEINPAEVIARRVATLRRAADQLASGTVTPEALSTPDGWTFDATEVAGLVDAFTTGDRADELADAVTKLATAKITRSTDTRDVGEWITRAFADMPVGSVLTVAQIITRGAIEGDPYRPSSGAVASRIKGGAKGCTVPGIEKAVASDGTTLAARKVN